MAQVKTMINIYKLHIETSAQILNETKTVVNLNIYAVGEWLYSGTNHNSLISITHTNGRNTETQKLVSQVQFCKTAGRTNMQFSCALFLSVLSVSLFEDYCSLYYCNAEPHNQLTVNNSK